MLCADGQVTDASVAMFIVFFNVCMCFLVFFKERGRCCSCALHVSAVHVSAVTRSVRSFHVFDDCACSDVIVHTVLASGPGTGHESSRTRDV